MKDTTKAAIGLLILVGFIFTIALIAQLTFVDADELKKARQTQRAIYHYEQAGDYNEDSCIDEDEDMELDDEDINAFRRYMGW